MIILGTKVRNPQLKVAEMIDGYKLFSDWLSFSWYLDCCLDEDSISLETYFCVHFIYHEFCNMLDHGYGPRYIYAPGVGIGEDRQVLMVWQNEEVYLEVEVHPDNTIEVYCRDRSVGAIWCLDFKEKELIKNSTPVRRVVQKLKIKNKTSLIDTM